MEGKERADKKERKEGLMVKKLKRGILVGKRGGPSTPSPTWRFHFPSLTQNQTNTNTSARKLCASLWEIQPQHHHSFDKMTNHTFHPHIPKYEDQPPIAPADLLATPSSLKGHVAALMQRHRMVERFGHALQPASPGSNGSSMEIAPYNPTLSPSCSSDNNGRKGKSRYGLKTSTELLKVLNRIWSLEEQHASNMLLLKRLKMELGHSRTQVQELLKEKQTDRKEINDLVNQIMDNKLLRKKREEEQIKAAVQSVRHELADERKLRNHAESLRRKLARELSEVKSSFSNTLKELERERKARILLENFCDEFAKSIRDYEYELRSLKKKAGIDCVDSRDQLILHISEAWLDERMQMKVYEAPNRFEDNTIVDKLTVDIETFLHAKRSVKSSTIGNFSVNEAIRCSSRHDSFPFNQEASAPQHAAYEDDSTDSDMHNLERHMSTSRKQCKQDSRRCANAASEAHSEQIVKSKSKRKMVKGFLKSEECMPRNNDQFLKVQDQIKNHSLLSEAERIQLEGELNGDPCLQSVFASCASPVKQWKPKLMSPEIEKSESSLMLPLKIKESTLEAELLEARIKGQKSCWKASRVS